MKCCYAHLEKVEDVEEDDGEDEEEAEEDVAAQHEELAEARLGEELLHAVDEVGRGRAEEEEQAQGRHEVLVGRVGGDAEGREDARSEAGEDDKDLNRKYVFVRGTFVLWCWLRTSNLVYNGLVIFPEWTAFPLLSIVQLVHRRARGFLDTFLTF